MDRDYALNHITHTPRYADARKAIRPSRVYPDPIYPQQAVIAELPFDLPFRCESVDWLTTRFSHRLPVYRPDQLGFFALLRSWYHKGERRKHIDILFVGEDVFLVWRKWLYVVYRGKKLLSASYRDGAPRQTPNSYEARVINYERGCIYADHPHLRKILSGVSI
jgi:hypothetical protein